ncbi:MAG: hypothetical protein LUC22_05605, partial [Prevotella sp.]|nr:hypothetical protein [Prevotella sp.]
VWDETAIAVYDANGRLVTQGKTGSHTETTNDEGDTTSVTIALDTTLKEAGEYTISLPDRFFYNDAEGTLPVMAFTSVVVVTGDVRDNLGVSPADGDTVDELFEITFTCSPIALVDDADVSQITVSFGEETVAHGNPDGITQDDNTISVALDSSLVQQGVYTVNIPEGLFLLDENGTISNYAISLTVNVSGLLDGINTVETIGVGGIIEVYNLSGQRINAPVSKRVNIVRRADGSVRKVITR